MNYELHEFIDRNTFDRESIQELQTLLPKDDIELDECISWALAWQPGDFIWIVLAALSSNRLVDARHIVKGAPFLRMQHLLIPVAVRMKGEVPEYLTKAVTDGTLDDLGTGQALFIIAEWCREYRSRILSEEIVDAVQALSRVKPLPFWTLVGLTAISISTTNSGLTDLEKDHCKSTEEWNVLLKYAAFGERQILQSETPLLMHLDGRYGPVHTVRFPRDFQKRLDSLDPRIARETMTLLGRVAAGERVQLHIAVPKDAEPFMMTPIGPDHFVYYRIAEKKIYVMDVLHRDVPFRKYRNFPLRLKNWHALPLGAGLALVVIICGLLVQRLMDRMTLPNAAPSADQAAAQPFNPWHQPVFVISGPDNWVRNEMSHQLVAARKFLLMEPFFFRPPTLTETQHLKYPYQAKYFLVVTAPEQPGHEPITISATIILSETGQAVAKETVSGPANSFEAARLLTHQLTQQLLTNPNFLSSFSALERVSWSLNIPRQSLLE